MNVMIKLGRPALLAGLLFGLSAPAMAVCPPILPCTDPGQAKSISGSNAERELVSFTQAIGEDTSLHAQTLIDSANATASSMNQGANAIIAAMFEASQIEANQDMQLMRAMGEMDMAMQMHITEQEVSQSRTIVSPDDTKEEFTLIIDALEKYEDLSVPEIVLMLRKQFDEDDENGFVNIPIASAEGVCSENAIKEDGKCVIPKRVFPSKKLQSMFKLCSIEKRALVESLKAKEAYQNSLALTNRATLKSLETTAAADAISSRVRKSKELSCTPAEYKSGYCGLSAAQTPEDYQEAIVAGAIIPNGDVSAANFTSPTSNSAEGYLPTSLTRQDDVAREMNNVSLDRRQLQSDPNQRVVPINHTYRNANQVLASLMFIDNLIADDVVPALKPKDRRKVSGAEYQARYLQRAGALSMSRMVMNQYMMNRVGTNMSKLINNGAFDERNAFTVSLDSPDNKEDALGAGPLDILEDRVRQQSANLQTAQDNPDSANAGNDFIASPDQNNSLSKMLDSMYLETEMMHKDYLMQEQINALDAIQLAQKANSPEMVRIMQQLRGGQ